MSADKSHVVRTRIASFLLLTVAMSWGLSITIMKDAIAREKVNSFLFYRFALAALMLLVIHPQIFKKLNKDVIKYGGITGLFLGAGFITQTFGIGKTSAAVAGFITGLYVVSTPIFEHFYGGGKLGNKAWIAVVFATIGLALLSLRGLSFGLGEFLVLLGSLMYTGQIVCLDRWSGGRDKWAMSFVQIAVVAMMAFIAACFEGIQSPPDDGVWGVILFTAIGSTVISFVIQTWSQSVLDSTKSAVIMTTEVVFAAACAVVIGGEVLSMKIIIGGLFVLTSMYLMVFDH